MAAPAQHERPGAGGEFRVSGTYHPRFQASSNYEDMPTGVVVAEGVPPTVAEHMDRRMLGYTNRVLPVLVDRADPSVSVVLWKEVRPVDYQELARQRAQEDARRVAGGVDPGASDPVVVDSIEQLPPWLGGAVDAALRGDGDGATGVHVELGDAARNYVVGAGPAAAAGRAARATLVSVSDVPVPPYALPGPTASLTDLTLRLQRPDGSSYTAQTRMGFRSAERRSTLTVIGASIPVLVDPDDETHVSIDVRAWG